VLNLKTSARNMLQGKIESVVGGAVNSEVTLRLDNGVAVYAIVTNESVQTLGLAPGKVASALIKSSWAILTSADEKITTSARNRLCGVVSRIKKGMVNTEVVLDLGFDTSFVAMITNESQNLLKFSVGSPVCALVKASHVILAVEE
jgi:molybdate transport system regulatory protein